MHGCGPHAVVREVERGGELDPVVHRDHAPRDTRVERRGRVHASIRPCSTQQRDAPRRPGDRAAVLPALPPRWVTAKHRVEHRLLARLDNGREQAGRTPRPRTTGVTSASGRHVRPGRWSSAMKISPLPWWATDPVRARPRPTRRASREQPAPSTGASVTTSPMHEPAGRLVLWLLAPRARSRADVRPAPRPR